MRQSHSPGKSRASSHIHLKADSGAYGGDRKHPATNVRTMPPSLRPKYVHTTTVAPGASSMASITSRQSPNRN